MNIKMLTITGIDHTSSIDALVQLQKDFPFLEYGILLGTSTGKPRYPDAQWVYMAMEKLERYSLHLCGKVVKEFMNNNILVNNDVYHNASRIQLNYVFPKFMTLTENFMSNFGNKRFVVQYNRKNASAIEMMPEDVKSCIDILVDSSGGTNKRISTGELSFNFDCNMVGYAGGISPENIEYICHIIDKGGVSNAWIDLESGARTSKNTFCVDKAKEICEVVKNYIE